MEDNYSIYGKQECLEVIFVGLDEGKLFQEESFLVLVPMTAKIFCSSPIVRKRTLK